MTKEINKNEVEYSDPYITLYYRLSSTTKLFPLSGPWKSIVGIIGTLTTFYHMLDLKTDLEIYYYLGTKEISYFNSSKDHLNNVLDGILSILQTSDNYKNQQKELEEIIANAKGVEDNLLGKQIDIGL